MSPSFVLKLMIIYISTTINRIIILSSTTAISNAPNPGKIYTEEDWNDAAINAVNERGKDASGGEKYSASKTLAEKGKYNERCSRRLVCC